PPALTVRSTGAVVPAAETKSLRRPAHLRHVADGRVAAPHRLAQDCDGAGLRPEQPQDRPHERRLARSVRAEHAHELASLYSQAYIGQDRAAAERDGDIVERDSRHEPSPASALSRATSWFSIQSW